MMVFGKKGEVCSVLYRCRKYKLPMQATNNLEWNANKQQHLKSQADLPLNTSVSCS